MVSLYVVLFFFYFAVYGMFVGIGLQQSKKPHGNQVSRKKSHHNGSLTERR